MLPIGSRSLLIAAFSGTRGRMRRTGRLPVLALMSDDGAQSLCQRERISFEVVIGLIWSQVKDRPPRHARTSRVYGDGPFRRLQGASRREEVLLAKLRGGRSLLLGETRKRVQGTDSTCPRCGEEEEDLEHVLRMCPADAAQYFREVFNWDFPRLPQH
jgi:hypothetical protein